MKRFPYNYMYTEAVVYEKLQIGKYLTFNIIVLKV